MEPVRINSHKFYKLVDIYGAIPAETEERLATFQDNLKEVIHNVDSRSVEIEALYTRFIREAEKGIRRQAQSPWSLSDEDAPLGRALSGSNFLSVVYNVVQLMRHEYKRMQALTEVLQRPPLMLSGERPDVSKADTFSSENMQRMHYEMEINGEHVARFTAGVLALRDGRKSILNSLDGVTRVLEGYYNDLMARHSTQGVEVFGDPMITDVAICIYENVDSHGEIEDGIDPGEVSAYSVQKAMVLTEATTSGLVGSFISDPDQFLEFIRMIYTAMWDTFLSLEQVFEMVIPAFVRVMEPYSFWQPTSSAALTHKLSNLEALDPRNVKYRDTGILMSAEERQAHNFNCETIRTIVEMLRADPSPGAQALVSYVLGRKGRLRDWQENENSFFVCRIGSGNQFKGISPGALEVIPGDRPTVNIDEIIGQGYDEIRDFIDQVESSAVWHDLFVASSPSRTADKSNVLLIGPQGCGKTEVLRAVGADERSLSIFAVGSDFLTCWSGEASKNPKRLFKAGLKLQKKTGRHVHFLIDEIDSILNNDRSGAGDINLTLEFQVLMDGVVAYPNLSVWGTTNSVERIPMPMIRRFAKVAIVGELLEADRIKLLKHFTGFMPTKGFKKKDWAGLAAKLDGATGDVIRKIIDPIWRSMMAGFVTDHEEEASKLLAWLNEDDKFDVSNFDTERRTAFKRLLGRHVSITPADVNASVDLALGNMAVLSEIEMAKRTYAGAKEFVSLVTENRAAS